jgi:DNA-directed RNA polymerase specialized sigma24 family protein
MNDDRPDEQIPIGTVTSRLARARERRLALLDPAPAGGTGDLF